MTDEVNDEINGEGRGFGGEVLGDVDILDFEPGMQGHVSVGPAIYSLVLTTYEDEIDDDGDLIQEAYEDFEVDQIDDLDDSVLEENQEVLFMVFPPTLDGTELQNKPVFLDSDGVQRILDKWGL